MGWRTAGVGGIDGPKAVTLLHQLVVAASPTWRSTHSINSTTPASTSPSHAGVTDVEIDAFHQHDRRTVPG